MRLLAKEKYARFAKESAAGAPLAQSLVHASPAGSPVSGGSVHGHGRANVLFDVPVFVSGLEHTIQHVWERSRLQHLARGRASASAGAGGGLTGTDAHQKAFLGAAGQATVRVTSRMF